MTTWKMVSPMLNVHLSAAATFSFSPLTGGESLRPFRS
jgi:hypothetical protein